MDNMKHRRLQELDRSDFEIVDGEPDIRGWDVKTASGQKIGAVEELILDAQRKKVRYMVVDLNDNELKLDHRKVLVPIGLAELHQKDDDVLLPNVSANQLQALPEYDKDHLDANVETRIREVLGTALAGNASGSMESQTDESRQMAERIIKETETNTRQTHDTTLRTAEHDSVQDKESTIMSTSSGTQGTEGRSGLADRPKSESGELPADFYEHEHFNDDNLYKHRLHEAQPAQPGKGASEYERGLRLWELRSEGGVIPNEADREGNTGQDSRRERYHREEIDEEARMEMVRNRRNAYEQRRHGGTGRDQYRENSDYQRDERSERPHQRRDNSIERRIRDEGLQDG
jgi:hypothetical protein